MYTLPEMLRGCGPVRSIDNLSQTSPDSIGFNKPCFGGFPRKYVAHLGQAAQKRRVSCDQPTQ